ncbi:hypothetical protein C2E23DRAFT_737931 [Lenzites betulinus]|nr:hypothetical protein C2E23DRAFT_737931 [Lenzites betulinus]
MAGNHPNNNVDGVIVPRGGWWLGSSKSMFKEQLAADIYLQDIWHTQGPVRRVATICVSWGMSIAVIQEAYAPVPGQPGPWNIENDLNHMIMVQDFGLQQLVVPGAPDDLPNQQPAGVGHFVVNNLAVMAARLPWHHRLIMEVQGLEHEGRLRLHYHKHHPRKGHRKMEPPKIRGPNDPKRKHWIFDQVVFSTQIQNCRRAAPLPVM